MRPTTICLLLSLALPLWAVACDSDDDKPEGAAEDTSESTVPVPRDIAGPREVEETGKPAVAAVEDVLGKTISKGQPVIIGARCEKGRCVVRYRSGPRGYGAVLETQSLILRRLFARDDVRSVALYVHHQSTGSEAKTEGAAFATTRCRRKDHPRFRWARIRPADIPRRCRTTHVAGGRQRSLVRRGKLTQREASLGKGGEDRRGPPPHANAPKAGGKPGQSDVEDEGVPPGQARE